jgi:glycerophosphoryl diester phosphodiesterase
MQQRLPSHLDPPLAFAHRGARAHAPENTIEAFTLARRLGATGIESDVWVSSDGVAVLDHDGVVRRGVRRVPISQIARADLPQHIPTLEEFYAACGTEFDLSLDVKTPAAYEAIADVVRAQGPEVPQRTWLCDPDLDRLVEHRDTLADFRLAHSTRLTKLAVTPELHAARLAELGIDVMNMHHTDWSGGLVVLFHRFGVLAFSWDLQFDHQLEGALRMGVDAVYSDHTDTMMDAMAREVGLPGT